MIWNFRRVLIAMETISEMCRSLRVGGTIDSQ